MMRPAARLLAAFRWLSRAVHRCYSLARGQDVSGGHASPSPSRAKPLKATANRAGTLALLTVLLASAVLLAANHASVENHRMTPVEAAHEAFASEYCPETVVEQDANKAAVARLEELEKDPAFTCDVHFGSAWLAGWVARSHTLCSIDCRADAAREVHTLLTCRQMADLHMPPLTKPHVLCDARNLYVTPSLMAPTLCLESRPGWMCETNQTTYHAFGLGAFAGKCEASARFDENFFPKDHLRDMFRSFLDFNAPPESLPGKSPVIRVSDASVDATPTLLITRERGEHNNVFHVFTDLFNAYLSLRALRLLSTRVQLVFLDDHVPSWSDGLWAAAIAGGGWSSLQSPWEARHPPETGGAAADPPLLMQRVHDLTGGTTLFHHAVFVPPGYTSLMYAHFAGDNSCPRAVPLWSDFRSFLRSRLMPPATWVVPSLSRTAAAEAAEHAAVSRNGSRGTHDAIYGRGGRRRPLRVTYISRRRRTLPSGEEVGPSKRFVRNEADVVTALESLSRTAGLWVTVLDLAGVPLAEQLAVLRGSDVLIGMHGAGMTWQWLLPPWASVIELWPRTTSVWRCYEHLATWLGLSYDKWSSPTSNEKDIVEVPVAAITELVLRAADKARAKIESHEVRAARNAGEIGVDMDEPGPPSPLSRQHP